MSSGVSRRRDGVSVSIVNVSTRETSAGIGGLAALEVLELSRMDLRTFLLSFLSVNNRKVWKGNRAATLLH